MYKWLTILVVFLILTACTNLYSQDKVNDKSDDYLRINNPTKRYFESSEKGISQGGEQKNFYPTEMIREITQFIRQDQTVKDVQVVSNNGQIIVYLQFKDPVTMDYIKNIENDLIKMAPDHEVLIYTMEDSGENK